MKHHRRHTDVKTDCWSAWYVRPASEQTGSCQCEKKKTELRKQLRQWVWMAASQASQTPGLGPNSSPPVGGKRPTAKEVAVGQRHLWLNTKIFWYGWMLLLEVLLKCLNKQPPLRGRWRLRHCGISGEGGWAGSRVGTACQLSSPLRVLHRNSNFHFCPYSVRVGKSWPFFLSTTCQHLLSAHCCGVFALHLPEVACQSHGTGRSVTPSANEVWVSGSCALSDCHCSFQWLSSFFCLFQVNRVEEKKKAEHYNSKQKRFS